MPQSSEVYLIGAARTPVGRITGGLASLSAPQLGGCAVKAACDRAGVPSNGVDELIMGQVVQAGAGQNPSRQAALEARLSPSTPAYTINKVCGSGLKAVMLGADNIQLGRARVVVAGGQESMSAAPHGQNLRSGKKFGDISLQDLVVKDGLWCASCDIHMGNLAEYTAEKAKVTREEQDQLALRSHKNAVAAMEAGRFRDEIAPVTIPRRRKDPVVVTDDEGPRADTSPEALGKLKPAFQKDGTVTAGNAPGLNDGAAALVLASDEAAKELGAEPLARIVAYETAFVEPKELFFAPIIAVRKLLKSVGGSDAGYFDLIEVNEAFAAQVLADHRELDWDWDRYNVNGGAIALGHPIGASGARVLVTLLYEMKRRDAKRGMAALCLGGGGAVAMAVERE